MIEGRPAVAIVDDDPRILESLKNLLESAGYSAHTFSGAAALLTSDHAFIDCLITDIGMPGMDGFELQDAMKQSKPELPVFLITGRHEIADQQRVGTKRITGFFHKPFDAQQLLSEVTHALGKIDGG